MKITANDHAVRKHDPAMKKRSAAGAQNVGHRECIINLRFDNPLVLSEKNL
jgi:hypothetical protein